MRVVMLQFGIHQAVPGAWDWWGRTGRYPLGRDSNKHHSARGPGGGLCGAHLDKEWRPGKEGVEDQDSPVDQLQKSEGAEGHGLTDHVRVSGFHSPMASYGGVWEDAGGVLRVHILSRRFLLNPLGNMNKERVWRCHKLQSSLLCTQAPVSFVSECVGCISPSLKAKQHWQVTHIQPLLLGRLESPNSSRKTNPDLRDSSPFLLYQSELQAGILRYHSQRGDTDVLASCRIHVV